MNALLNTFAPITLAEMKSVRLMNRVDTKFVTTVPRLLQLLEMAKGEYFVQEIDGERNSAYTTLYYDTPRLDMYIMHHNGCLGRQKVRVRQYVDSNLTFLEVKNKNNHRLRHHWRAAARVPQATVLVGCRHPAAGAAQLVQPHHPCQQGKDRARDHRH